MEVAGSWVIYTKTNTLLLIHGNTVNDILLRAFSIFNIEEEFSLRIPTDLEPLSRDMHLPVAGFDNSAKLPFILETKSVKPIRSRQQEWNKRNPEKVRMASQKYKQKKRETRTHTNSFQLERVNRRDGLRFRITLPDTQYIVRNAPPKK